MRLSISNIAWDESNDREMYKLIREMGFDGLEIAPTRIFPESPYENQSRALVWKENLKEEFGLDIPSMQSIWYGRKENLFGSDDERASLVDYTRKAIDFASVINCKNLVFGCPRNRNVPEGADQKTATSFFKEIGDYAALKGTVIGMEANPTVYNTNFINDTISAIRLIEEVSSAGFKLNLDVGTILENKEDISVLSEYVHLVNHVHISEPSLVPVVKRDFHVELRKALEDAGYDGYISIEMKKMQDIDAVREIMEYVKDAFG